MPSQTTTIGNLTLPVPAGAQNSDLDDPTVSGIADYLRFWLRNSLNTKLANTQGTSADAVPSANVFKYDPNTYFVRNAFPALYVWWNGRSSVETNRSTLLYDVRKRELHVLWLFDEMLAPNALTPRHGLLAAVDATLAKALERMRHPSYGYGSDAAGTSLLTSLNLVGAEYLGGEAGFMAGVPASDSRAGGPGEGQAQRGYPALKATIAVWERIDQDTLEDPGDVMGDTLLTINASGDGVDAVELMQRWLTSPDGSEDV